MNKEQLKTFKASLELSIEETNDLIEHAPTDADWQWHVGYRTALKEVLDAVNKIEV